ncbi:hypothetical protein [Bdellovibrio svalbardensis]|uniref:Uncharacterized protein n=1 Tax=Bdellovibrio svalbardensis TaxID=2972972 RepID=A0ABT6DJK7_9BACT|nr:hypothetical protein [Bdellovibrio svalbardensis]MDG0817020.1 hypothetical protein [Bdellovibrio svalbardensis]
MENLVRACISILLALHSTSAFAKADKDSLYLIAANDQSESSESNQSDYSGLVNSTTCVRQMNALIAECRNENASATNSCDEKQDTGIMGTMRQAASILGTATAASIQASCSKMAALSQAANAAVAAYQANCASSISSCQSACSKAVEHWKSHNKCIEDAAFGPPPPPPSSAGYDEARDLLKICQDLNPKADEAAKAMQNYALTAANAQNCADESSGVSTAALEICKANPNLEGCTQKGPVDCTKPEMASNKVCICSKNPNDASCMGVKSAAGTNIPGAAEFASRVKPEDSGVNGEDNYGLPTIEQGKINGSFAEASVEGKQGAGANLSQNGFGSGVGGVEAGKAEGKTDKNSQEVNSGFYGGGGGGYGSSSVSSGDARSGFGGMLDKVGDAFKKSATDLRQFLPGGTLDPKARGIAGASGPDGITGPHTNIWQKIQNRYQVVSPTLIP